MASCGSLSSLFENPLPENPTLIESLTSWKQIKPIKPIEVSSFAEIFGELYFQEKPELRGSRLPLPTLNETPRSEISESDEKKSRNGENSPVSVLPKNPYQHESKNNGVFSSKKSSESLQLCTEGLGSESSDDVDDLLESGEDWSNHGKTKVETGRRSPPDVRSSKGGRGYPPPISSIGRSGKPWVCLRSYREDGRFVLREIRTPSQEFLHASREDGRLKLHFIHPDEDIEEGEGEGGGEEEEEEKKEISESQSN